MKTDKKDFCEKYIKKVKNDKDIAEREIDWDCDFRDRVHFTINVSETSPSSMVMGGPIPRILFTLDAEDLHYLYTKYSSQVVKELADNIQELKAAYGFNKDAV